MRTNRTVMEKYHQFFNSDDKKVDEKSLRKFFDGLSDAELTILLDELESPKSQSPSTKTSKRTLFRL